MKRPRIRQARREDARILLRLIKELAAFENMLEQVRASEEDLLRDGFGPTPRFECLIAEIGDAPVGFALYFHNYSTFEGRAGLYLEDIYVAPEARNSGIGRMLMARLARIAIDRDCPRFELSVLHWNPARRFYERLGFAHCQDWLPHRLHGAALDALARSEPDNG